MNQDALDRISARSMVCEEIAEILTNAAFEVFTDTDGNRSIRVHREHEGLTLATQIVREAGGLLGTRSSADVLVQLESWLRVQRHRSRRWAGETSDPAHDAVAEAFTEVLDKLADLRGGR